MKTIQSLIVLIGLAIGTAAPASAQGGVGGSLEDSTNVVLYRFPGVLDDGNFVATVFHCTNFSGALEAVRFVIRAYNGSVAVNKAFTVPHGDTITVVTHPTRVYEIPNQSGVGQLSLFSGDSRVYKASAAIAATSIYIVCNAMVIEAGGVLDPRPFPLTGYLTFGPIGVALRGIRFNPVPGTQE